MNSPLGRAAWALGFIGLLACGGTPQPRPASAAPGSTAVAVAADTGAGLPLAARTLGSDSAPVTVYEMSDFQCPFCQRHALNTFPALRREYIETGKVRWIYIFFPLTTIHHNALPAAEFAVCAARAGKFWQAHDLLFAHQSEWAELPEAGPYFLTLADSLDLPRQQILNCVKDPSTQADVEADAAGAARAGANSTPSFYIEGGLLAGAAPLPVFEHILDSVYAVKTAHR
ncbi:MAG TPA: thioredoxin domain-containing protein [Gemmatimonadales bacterium]|nr:thioredoxin domain-containing protein [Gemmatimonadales bacterium]